MHSRIFHMAELPDKPEDIDNLLMEKDCNYEDAIYESIQNIADYVNFSDSYKDDIEWLTEEIKKENLGRIESYRDVYIFFPDVEGIKDYYGRKLIEIFTQTKTLDTEDFVSNIWNLQNILEDKYSFYVYDGSWANSLDFYLRDIIQYNYTVPKLILNSYDYHF